MQALTRAALTGAATGLRSSAGLGILVEAREPGLPEALRAERARVAAAMAIVSELIVDKLPSTPSRLEPRGLTSRVIAAAAAGAAVARGANGPVVKSAAVSAGCALLAARVGHDLRAELSRRRSAFVIAAAEDVLALSLASNAS